MYNSLLWYNDPCHCHVCVNLRTSFQSAYEAVTKADKSAPSFPSIVNAAVAIGEAAEALHGEHNPESYLKLEGLSLTASPRGEVCIYVRMVSNGVS